MEEGGHPNGKGSEGQNILPTSYEDYLSARGLDTNIVPTPVEPYMTTQYRSYLQTPLEQRPQHEQHLAFQKGKFDAYGSYRDALLGEKSPMLGPLEFSKTYQTTKDFGPDYGIAFKKENYKALFASKGYELDTLIACNPDDLTDHQVWRVLHIASQQYFACKFASSYFYAQSIIDAQPQQIVARVTHESRVLSKCRNDNIIGVKEVIEISDVATSFPYIFVATIMELMSGTAESLMKTDPNGQLPMDLAKRCVRDCVLAVDYLQNQMDNYRIAHLAIMPRNILYSIPYDQYYGIPMPAIFKLGDFEECIVYQKKDEIPNVSIDLWTDITRPPYNHEFSSPEFTAGIYDYDLLENLRLFPNDIYSIAFSVAYMNLGGVSSRLDQARFYRTKNRMRQMSANPADPFEYVVGRMSNNNPDQRISAAELLKSPEFQSLVPPVPFISFF